MARTIYLLHFDRPFSHARHYMGSAEDLDVRLAEHAAGAGARLLWVGPAGRDQLDPGEDLVGRSPVRAQLKARGHARHCPICTPPRQPGRCGR